MRSAGQTLQFRARLRMRNAGPPAHFITPYRTCLCSCLSLSPAALLALCVRRRLDLRTCALSRTHAPASCLSTRTATLCQTRFGFTAVANQDAWGNDIVNCGIKPVMQTFIDGDIAPANVVEMEQACNKNPWYARA